MAHPHWSIEPPSFSEKAYRRDALFVWDERWDALSVEARRLFLEAFEPTQLSANSPVSPVPTRNLHGPAWAELARGGFVRLAETSGREMAYQRDEVANFAARVRGLVRYPVLDAKAPNAFLEFTNFAYAHYQLKQTIDSILKKNGIASQVSFGTVFDSYVARRRWPEWVANYLGLPLAGQLIGLVEASATPIYLTELQRRLPKEDPLQTRNALEGLVRHLVLFEGLDPVTLRLVIGMLPSVRADREQARHPKPPPELIWVVPESMDPDTGTTIPHMRGLLMELSAGRARLKQDGTPYQKDLDRLTACIDGVPVWASAYHTTSERLALIALRFARRMNFTQTVKEKAVDWLTLSEKGSEWLAQGLNQQYSIVYAALREPPCDQTDAVFTSSDVTSVPLEAGAEPEPYTYRSLTTLQRTPLREALYRALAEIPGEEFVTLESFLAYTLYRSHNPVLLERAAERVAVRIEGRLLPALEEQFEPAGRRLLSDLVRERLIPFGCVQAAHDHQKQLLIRRTPRLDWFFGKAEPPAATESGSTRVLVQPDFSIVVIGLDPAPAADLVPFCTRVQGMPGSGSLTLKISKESVMKAIEAGFPPGEVLPRIQKHAQGKVPSNVAREVGDWCAGVRSVTPLPAIVLHCPDATATERVLSVLGKKVARVSDTLVLWLDGKPGSVERQKLLLQGILLAELEETGGKKAKKGKRKKRRG